MVPYVFFYILQDTFFPNLDSDEDWEMTEEGEVREFEGIHYRYTTYRRKEG